MDKERCIERKLFEVEDMVNASGAGDSFFAGILYGYMNDLSIEDSLDRGLAAGIMAIRSHQAINPDMNIEEIEKIIKENRK